MAISGTIMMRGGGLAAALAIMGAGAPAQISPDRVSASARPLVGNTLIYAKPDRPGETTAVYFRLDGTGLASARREGHPAAPKSIRWATLSDRQFCMAETGRNPWDGDCGILSIDGDQVTLAPKGGPPWSGKIVEGDAWALDPATPTRARLAGKRAIETLIGNTLAFTPLGGGRDYAALYFLADGTVRRGEDRLDREPDFTHWVLQRHERWSIGKDGRDLCITGGNAGGGDYCAAIAIAGDLVTLNSARHGLMHGILRKGDPQGLSPDAAAVVKAKADALIGNTLVFERPDRPAGGESVIYFQADGIGRGRGVGGEKPSVTNPIRWLLRLDGSFCLIQGLQRFRDYGCVALSVSGDAVTLKAPDNPAISGRILKGNPRKL